LTQRGTVLVRSTRTARPGSTPVRHDRPMSDAGIHVRPARLDDLDLIWPLTQEFATSFDPQRAAFDSAFAALVARPDTFMAVAELPAGGIAGYTVASSHLTLFANGPVAWVEELMVSPGARRGGVGASLMRAAEQWPRCKAPLTWPWPRDGRPTSTRPLGTRSPQRSSARTSADSHPRAVLTRFPLQDQACRLT